MTSAEGHLFVRCVYCEHTHNNTVKVLSLAHLLSARVHCCYNNHRGIAEWVDSPMLFDLFSLCGEVLKAEVCTCGVTVWSRVVFGR